MADRNKEVKLKRKFISLETKLQILDRLTKGEKVSEVGKSLDLNEATIRTIHKNEHKIRSAVAAGSSTSVKYAVRSRPQIIEKMEKALSFWIDECSQKRIPLDGNVIKQKSLKIYHQLKADGETPANPDFVASNGWFEKFKKRHRIQNIKVQGEVASADIEAANHFPEELQSIIQEKNYSAHQVFNADETALWWKKMPNRTFISKAENVAPGFKASKDRITLLLCSNASGDFCLKPMVIYKSLNPRALKGVNKDNLPVFWRSNSKAWVTADLFKNWFHDSFVPQVEDYLKTKNLDFKAVLIIDNAPGHPKNLSHPNIEVIFLPPNTTSLLQPLDQGIIYTFKTYYIRKSLQWILDLTEEKSIDVKEAWKLFTIKHCLNIIDLSLKDLKKSTLNGCWKKLWPSAVEEQNMLPSSTNEIESILQVANDIGGEGFADMTADDVQELLTEEVNEEMLLQITTQVSEQSDSEASSNEGSEVQCLTINELNKGLKLAKKLEQFFVNVDPSTERSLIFKRELNACLSPYIEIHKSLINNQQQTKITNFFKKKGSSDISSPSDSDPESHSTDFTSKRRRTIVLTSNDDSSA